MTLAIFLGESGSLFNPINSVLTFKVFGPNPTQVVNMVKCLESSTVEVLNYSKIDGNY